MSFSSINTAISSPPATLRKSSPLSDEFSFYEWEPEEHLAEEYAQERELISPALSTSNAAAPLVTRKNENHLLLRHHGFGDIQSLLNLGLEQPIANWAKHAEFRSGVVGRG